jgi:putative cardiolipin synthase
MVRHEAEAEATGLVSTVPVLPGSQTSVSLVPDNLIAFALRVRSARTATRTLHLQYYSWKEDVTGRLLARAVLHAADRGVQVRLLLDDLYVRENEHTLRTLSQHPAIDVRLFNPFQLRSCGALGRAAEFLFAGYRVNHRMHNKAWIADGTFLVGGGRNIGDEYFDASSQFNFRDLDLAVSGAAVLEAVAIFQRYWTNRRVRPVEQVAVSHPLSCGLDGLRRMLDDAARSATAASYLQRCQTLPELTGLLATARVPLAVDKVKIIADPPGKALGRRRAPGVLGAVRDAVGSAQGRVLLISPYFVPGRRGARLLTALLRRGVKVSLLTNSLAATDVLAVHGGYARYRKRLLRAGIELYELKRGGQEGQSLFGSGGASLHTKAFTVDGKRTFVGSFNLDPRSANLNTEMGTFVEDPEVADQLREEYDRLTDPARSWSVRLEGGRMAWHSRVDGQMRVLHGEPDAPLIRRILARILGWLPIEPQL